MSKENLKTPMEKKSPMKLEYSSKPPRPHAVRSVRFESTTSSSSFREIITGSGRSSSMRRSSSPPPPGWPIKKPTTPRRSFQDASPQPDNVGPVDNSLDLIKKQNMNLPEMELMKERFAKLLLGEDMSGSGKGVCTALAISNSITNLCATVFGQLWRLEPLPPEKKSMWKREMDWLLCASDHIVELIPAWQTFSDGTKLEVMSCRPRSDIHLNLPALRKLDNMLLEILDSFSNTEFWYVDQGVMAADSDGTSSFRRISQREDDKWWLPVPRVPAGGLRETSRKQLDHKRECTNQILKAVVAINSSILAEMEIPESFLEALPKNGRVCLGDMIYRYITSEHFSPDCLLDCLDLSSDHVAVEIANRVEAAIFMWRRRHHHPKIANSSRSSWMMVRDFVAVDGDKREVVLADRAERLLLCLKQRCPGLTQTALDTSKIQFNKDVGKSILESYSRVLESLAFNIVARIDDLMYVDDLTKCTDRLTSVKSPGPTVSTISSQKKKITRTPDRRSTDVAVAHSGVLQPKAKVSPAGSSSSRKDGTRATTPSGKDDSINGDDQQPPSRGGGLGVRRVLSNYLGGEMKVKQIHEGSRASTDGKTSSSVVDKENDDPQRAVVSSSVKKGGEGSKSTSKRH